VATSLKTGGPYPGSAVQSYTADVRVRSQISLYGFMVNKVVLSVFSKYFYFLGHAVARFVGALRYKLEGHGFDSRWCHWNFSLT
jgi:hypothetical protein